MNGMKTGKYWIGDPSFVFDAGDDEENGKFDWMEFCQFSMQNEGIVTHQGITFAFFHTKDFDGESIHPDNYGNEYGTSTGLIACIPIEDVIVDGLDFGSTVEFNEPFFEVSNRNNVIKFGEMEIDTNINLVCV